MLKSHGFQYNVSVPTVSAMGEKSLADKENIRYRAVLPPSARTRLLLRGILAFGVVLSALLWATQADRPLACALATIALVGLPALLVCTKGIVTVDAESLRLTAFPLFRKTVPLSGIESVKVSTVDPMREYHGLGYRVAANGEVALAFDRGPAVQAWMSDEKVYVIGDPDAEALAEVLRTAVTERH